MRRARVTSQRLVEGKGKGKVRVKKSRGKLVGRNEGKTKEGEGKERQGTGGPNQAKIERVGRG